MITKRLSRTLINHRDIGMNRLILIALTTLFFTTCAAADPKTLGADAANSGHFAEAYRLWLPLAENGDREVQEAVALLLNSNEDVGLSLSSAERDALTLEWLGRSASNGQSSAMKWLSDAYKNGWLGLPRNGAAEACWMQASNGVVASSDCKRLFPLPKGKRPAAPPRSQ